MPSWKEVVDSRQYIGGEIESREGYEVYRGPIKEIRIEGGLVVIEAVWVACMDLQGGRWHKTNGPNSVFVSETLKPRDLGDGKLVFGYPGIMSGVLIPATGSKLDPKKVLGLDIT